MGRCGANAWPGLFDGILYRRVRVPGRDTVIRFRCIALVRVLASLLDIARVVAQLAIQRFSVAEYWLWSDRRAAAGLGADSGRFWRVVGHGHGGRCFVDTGPR